MLVSDKGLEIFEPRFTSLRENVSYVRLDLADVERDAVDVALKLCLTKAEHLFSKID